MIKLIEYLMIKPEFVRKINEQIIYFGDKLKLSSCSKKIK